jgi:hypothetical protein
MDNKTRLILILGVLAFFVILVDLSLEIAKEKDEIGFFVTSLENLDDAGSNLACLGAIIPITDIVILLENNFIVQEITTVVHSERGPPIS